MPVLAIWFVTIVLILGLITGYVRHSLRDGGENVVPQEEPSTDATLFNYSSSEGYTFSYPQSYVVIENPIEKNQGPDFQTESLSLMTRTEYKNLMGSDVPREGPTSISIEVFENSRNLSAGAWVETSPRSNFNREMGNYKNTTLAGETAVAYAWSGLYEGESVAVSYDKKMYIFSVTWMSQSDVIRSDFRDLLASVDFR